MTDPASWNLYTYVRNNPLRYIDPLGERISVADLSDEDREELLRRVNATYGCEGCVSVEDGFLQVDTSGLSQKVIEAMSFLTGAINSDTLHFQVVGTNNSAEVGFGRIYPRQGSVTYDGLTRSAHKLALDFADFNRVGGDEDSVAAFLDFVFAHEVARRSPQKRDDPRSGSAT